MSKEETEETLQMNGLNRYSAFRLRHLVFHITSTLTLIYAAPSICQEYRISDLADLETRTLFFTGTESNQQTWESTHLNILSPFSQSLRPFRQQLVDSRSSKRVSVAQPVWGGLLGATVGFFGGAFVGAAVSGRGYDAVGGSILGALIGEALVMPLGVHYGNRCRGDLGLDMLTSIAISAASLLIINETDADESWLILVPIFQIGSTVAVERATAHHR